MEVTAAESQAPEAEDLEFEIVEEQPYVPMLLQMYTY
jgi:hypothetical protein